MFRARKINTDTNQKKSSDLDLLLKIEEALRIDREKERRKNAELRSHNRRRGCGC